ncbi:hypothetical protein [Aestuariivirga sp.]|uniref:hypothetical protein n=1 Tax=Aestuariivirga sp. TaxID=2650926 RepID=UPI0039E36394
MPVMRLATAVLAAFLLFVPEALAAQSTEELVDQKLRAGELKPLENELSQRLAVSPSDDQLRFALGATQFLRTVEQMAQSMYRYGLAPTRQVSRVMPFFRFPVPVNPHPEHLDYAKMQTIFSDALKGFETADATLSKMGKTEVTLPIAIGLVRLDLNGDGKADESETLWKVFDATLGGNMIQPEQAAQFVIKFDRGDASWLRGYANLLSAILDFQLAHDWHESFDVTFHMLFPNAGLPGAVVNEYERPFQYSGFDDGTFADLITFIHLAHWPVTEPERMKASLAHLETVVAMSRESWSFILSETDDDAEWIPSPRQKNGVLGIPVTQETVTAWMAFLNSFDGMLQGKVLLPHWRFEKGINLRRVFLEPQTFDPILWAQGYAAIPYLETGPIASSSDWNRIMGLFEGNFFGYAAWFN